MCSCEWRSFVILDEKIYWHSPSKHGIGCRSTFNKRPYKPHAEWTIPHLLFSFNISRYSPDSKKIKKIKKEMHKREIGVSQWGRQDPARTSWQANDARQIPSLCGSHFTCPSPPLTITCKSVTICGHVCKTSLVVHVLPSSNVSIGPLSHF